MTTFVTMVAISGGRHAWYVGTGELDSAGAYVAGRGRPRWCGPSRELPNVVGLPLAELAELLATAGWPTGRHEPPG